MLLNPTEGDEVTKQKLRDDLKQVISLVHYHLHSAKEPTCEDLLVILDRLTQCCERMRWLLVAG